MFVVDTSNSFGYSRFQLVRELIENITTNIAVNSPETLFGLITFDSYARLEFNITRHTDLSTLLPAIDHSIAIALEGDFLTNSLCSTSRKHIT